MGSCRNFSFSVVDADYCCGRRLEISAIQNCFASGVVVWVMEMFRLDARLWLMTTYLVLAKDHRDFVFVPILWADSAIVDSGIFCCGSYEHCDYCCYSNFGVVDSFYNYVDKFPDTWGLASNKGTLAVESTGVVAILGSSCSDYLFVDNYGDDFFFVDYYYAFLKDNKIFYLRFFRKLWFILCMHPLTDTPYNSFRVRVGSNEIFLTQLFVFKFS